MSFRAMTAVAGLVIIAAVVLVLAACSSGPDSGYVWAKSYTAPWQQYISGYHIAGSCYGSGSGRQCSSGTYIPGHFQYWPAQWALQLCVNKPPDTGNNSCGWRGVDEGTYDSAAVGAYYQTRADG